MSNIYGRMNFKISEYVFLNEKTKFPCQVREIASRFHAKKKKVIVRMLWNYLILLCIISIYYAKKKHSHGIKALGKKF